MKEKEITVVINATAREVEKRKYSFEEVVKLVFGTYDGKDYTMTSTNKNGKDMQNYSPGSTINMKEGMRINVTTTNTS